MNARPIEPPAGRSVFTRLFAPAPADIDENGHVNNVVYLRWVQETAIAHWTSLCPPEEAARWAWIVLRHEVDYRRPLLPGETAAARTWVADTSDGPRFDRFVRIDGPDGGMCAQARTVWCLIELPSRRPRRVPAWMVEMFA
jgi:acyl-CoA thioester hydrolase